MQTLKEIVVTASRPLLPAEAAVENMSRVVCSLLMRSISGEIPVPDFWKISIRINAPDPSENGKVLLGVLIVGKSFPSSDFIGWSKERRQAYMLRFIEEALREVFLQRNLDLLRLSEAVQYVLSQGFKNVFVGEKRFKGPAGMVAHIECEQEMDEARIYVVCKAKSSHQHRVLLVTTVPEEFIFQSYFGRIQWQDSRHGLLHKVDGTSIPFELPT